MVTVAAHPSPAVRAPGATSRRPLVPAPVRRAVGSALALGVVRWQVRQSKRSFSGRVLMVGFGCFVRAARFAAAWGSWCGFPLGIRRVTSRGSVVWAVSLPVSAPGWRAAPPRKFAGRCWFARRG